MGPFHVKTGALLVAGIMFTATPLFAQRDGERRGDGRDRRGGTEHAQRRGEAPRGEWRGQYDNRYNQRRYDNWSFGNRNYNYRSYVLPYGYRPYGYRPGWNLNLYFGRPYYGYNGYPGAVYGYYALAPGHPYGAVRIVDAPRDAQVFVDGYYAGVVDNYDGVFQHLNLEVGPHHIEIEEPGYPPIGFEVRVEPGRTITYHANLR